MDKTELRNWILYVMGKEVSRASIGGQISGTLHFDLYDDCGAGRLGSFEMRHGKVTWWTWTDAINKAQWPIKLVLNDGVMKLWLGERDWRRAA